MVSQGFYVEELFARKCGELALPVVKDVRADKVGAIDFFVRDLAVQLSCCCVGMLGAKALKDLSKAVVYMGSRLKFVFVLIEDGDNDYVGRQLAVVCRMLVALDVPEGTFTAVTKDTVRTVSIDTIH